VNLNHKLRRLLCAAMALGVVAVLVSACGSGGATAGGASAGATASLSISGMKQTGPGLTEPTDPSGAKTNGGTVYFSETAGSPPNYIFPMYSAQYCGSNNVQGLNAMLYRPLYWYGNNYSPTVDYNDSIGKAPVWSDGDKTVTVHLNHDMWSDGEQVSSRDLALWMNVLKADPSREWCLYKPGLFPDNVVSYSTPNPTTFVLHLNRAYNPSWFLYNELSQIYPLPIAWDRTSLSSPAPSPTAPNLPDTTKAGAAAVYNFLNKQGAEIATWASSPLWKVVDGPFSVTNVTSNGGLTLSTNPDYSGSPKPTISKFVEVPFTTDTATFDEVKSGGPSALTISALPAQDVPQESSVEAEGYSVNKAALYSVNFFPLNLNNPTVGPVFRQEYFRQAFQHLVDQDGWISSFLHNTAVPTYGPVPTAPQSPFVASSATGANPYPFSTTAAAKLLTDNGWKVVPNGASYCAKPGTGAGECGAGITSGEKISFNLDYMSGVTVLASEMTDLQSDAKQVGIDISLTEHPFDDVYAAAVHCTAKQPDCKWTAENWGAGWVYFPDYFPSGEYMLSSDSIDNYSNYASPEMDKLIQNTVLGPPSEERENMTKFEEYAEKTLPMVFEPTSIGTFGASAGTLISDKLGGYAANAYGFMTPEDWYLTK
jgi:peptide/nickel transport system substrate-binding protein